MHNLTRFINTRLAINNIAVIQCATMYKFNQQPISNESYKLQIVPFWSTPETRLISINGLVFSQHYFSAQAKYHPKHILMTDS